MNTLKKLSYPVLYTVLCFSFIKTANAQATSIRLGPGVVDVVPRQIVRASNDRVYIFASAQERSRNLVAYRSGNALPASSSDFVSAGSISLAGSIISADSAYDGNSTIFAIANLGNGQIIAVPFDINSNTFKSAQTLATNGMNGDYQIGTSGLSSMFDKTGTLHVSYWSSGNHISYASFNNTNGSLSQKTTPQQLDSGAPSNHPSLAVSPTDNSVTVAWIHETEAQSNGEILARTLRNGVWGGNEKVSTSRVWVSPNSGVNIDQGPSLVIDSNGTRHLSYMENWPLSGGGEYGKIHYCTNSSGSWSDIYVNASSHDPAMAITNSNQIYILGHGHPDSITSDSACKDMDNICILRKNGNSWGQQTVVAKPSGGVSFDASVSVKWSVVGWNRPDLLEFAFFSTPYTSSTAYYGRYTTDSPTPSSASSTRPTNNPTIRPSASGSSKQRCQPLGDMNDYPNCKGFVTVLDLSYLISKIGLVDYKAHISDTTNTQGIVNSIDLSVLLQNLGNK